MLRLAPALALLFTGSAAQALDLPPVCKALHGLAEAARANGPQRITFRVLPGGNAYSACSPVDTGAKKAFCSAAIDAAGMENPHLVAWKIRACVQTMAADPQVITSDEGLAPGKKKITRLAAKLGGGVRLDVSAAAGDRYDVTVWKAD